MGAEPHIVGKLRWVWGGAVGMGAMDWFDLLMHGAPWVWLLFTLLQFALPKSPSGPMVSAQSVAKLNQTGAHRSVNGSKESS